MIEDEVMQELRQQREDYAVRHNYDLSAMCQGWEEISKSCGRQLRVAQPLPLAHMSFPLDDDDVMSELYAVRAGYATKFNCDTTAMFNAVTNKCACGQINETDPACPPAEAETAERTSTA